jgi:NAD-dependent DNA ligase
MGSFRNDGDVAFRLLHELEGLLEGISADHLINEAESQRIRRWLDENAGFDDVHPFSEMASHLRKALTDGVITLDECDDLLFVVRNLTRANHYFDSLRGGVQILSGLLAGIAADGILRPIEVEHLQGWTEQWGYLQGLWPFDECVSIVTAALVQRQLEENAKSRIFALSRHFPVAGDTRGKPPLLEAVCATDPRVEFHGKAFVFTGESPKAEREVMVAHVEGMGGVHHHNVRLDSNYLVVCEAGSPYWAFACYGRKIEKALDYRKRGQPLLIIHERDFWDALV